MNTTTAIAAIFGVVIMVVVAIVAICLVDEGKNHHK